MYKTEMKLWDKKERMSVGERPILMLQFDPTPFNITPTVF